MSVSKPSLVAINRYVHLLTQLTNDELRDVHDLSALAARTLGPYFERAYRYCHHHIIIPSKGVEGNPSGVEPKQHQEPRSDLKRS